MFRSTRRTGAACALAAVLTTTAPATAAEGPAVLQELDQVLSPHDDPAIAVQAVIGREAYVHTPAGRLAVRTDDTVRYRGQLYRILLEGKNVVLVALEGQDSLLLPVDPTDRPEHR